MSTPNSRRIPSGAPTPPPKGPIDNSPNRPPSTASTPTSTGQGLGRSPSIRQSRPMRKPGSRMSTSIAASELNFDDDEDAKATNTQLIADLKESVLRAEQASEQYRKQLEVMQKRLDDAATEQTASEERDFQRQTEIDHLRAEIKDNVRQRRELELSHDSEKNMLLQDRERQATKEADLQAVIKRLNETLRSKGLERSNTNRNVSTSNTESSEVDLDAGDDKSQDLLQALQEKDNAIESLKLELAEIHVQIAEQEHMGDGRLQNLEKDILETKMLNARLLEENESFQMLLSEKTLKGHFITDSHHHEDTSGLSTLAEELESAGDEPEPNSDSYRKLETDLRTLREENKALTLYIDKIVGRLLQHDGFEHIIHDKDNPTSTSKAATNKELPLPPPPPTPPPSAQAHDTGTVTSAAVGLLQRARSVVSRPAAPKSRPTSHVPAGASVAAASANENPETAPSIPLNRGHRRARSDQAQADLGAAQVVQQMNRGSPLRTVSGGPISPGIGPMSPPFGPTRSATFSQPGTNTRTTSASGGHHSSSNSITSEHSLERDSTEAISAPGGQANNQPLPGAVMKQNQLRPLRLVQEQTILEEEQKRANRSSWMGWFKGGALEAQPPE